MLLLWSVSVSVLLLCAGAGAGAAQPGWPECPVGAGGAGGECYGDYVYDDLDGWSSRDYLVDGSRLIVSMKGKDVRWRCSQHASLSASMPAFRNHARIDTLTLTGCEVPDKAYLEVLKRNMNVSVTELLEIQTWPHPPLTNIHLRFDEIPKAIKVHSYELMLPEDDFVSSLVTSDVSFNNIHISPVAARMFPGDIVNLEIEKAGLKELPLEMKGMTFLNRLTVRDDDLVNISVVPDLHSLHYLTLEAPDVALPDLHRLHNITIINLNSRKMLRVFGECTNLRNLNVLNGDMVELEEGWLERCSRLEEMRVRGLARLRRLPARLLAGLRRLRRLDLSRNSLEALPEDLFESTPLLQYLDLSRNRLHISGLERSMFRPVRLQTLDLSYNELSASQLVALDALDPTSLTTLALSGNSLADACDTDDVFSFLFHSIDETQLQRLVMTRAAVQAFCSKWLQLPHLRLLKLNNNAISHIPCDKGMTRKDKLTIDLRDNPVTSSDHCYQDDLSTAVLTTDAIMSQL